MLVMKFGGTSVRDAACIRTVHDLVARAARRRPVTVIVSAHSGVTNALDALAREAVRSPVTTETLRARHRSILRELGLDETLHDALFKELDDLLRGIRLVGEVTPRSLDYVLSFGERFSVRTVAAWFVNAGTPAVGLDAFDAGLVTDASFGRARPLPDGGRIKRTLSAIAADRIPIVTGYIAKDEKGNITTLGRNGSDYSASIFGNALDAEEIQIWTDVDGVLTADPKLVPAARPIRKLSFAEASELAYYGGKVLHPATLLPAMEKKIPVRVLDTHHPESPGTLILEALDEAPVVVRSIAHKRGIHLITIQSTRMLEQHGFLARIFAVFERHEIVIDMVATTEISVSVTTDNDRNLDPAAAELGKFSEVTVEKGLALVCVVGHGMAREPGIAGQVFGTLAERKIPVRMISHGALRLNISFLVDDARCSEAVQALHARFIAP